MQFEKFLKSRWIDVILFALSVLLFGFKNTWSSWFVFVPVFLFVHHLSIRYVSLFGVLYGFLSYFIYLFWMFHFSAVALFGCCFLYAFYWAILFVIIKIVLLKAKDFSVILLPVVITLYEYVRTLGFLGFSYGINAYSQYENLCFIQIADIFGVWGVSFVLNLCSSVIYFVLVNFRKEKFYKSVTAVSVFLVLVAAVNIYGIVRIHYFKQLEEKSPYITVIAVQNNSDPWKGGIQKYENDLEDLISLTDKALEENPTADLIVWPETAVIPSILKHYDSADERRKNLVRRLLSYVDGTKTAFVIGNYNSIDGNDYNSAFFFEPGKNVIPPMPHHYEKNHLVPFCEYFPYKKQFPYFYEKLLGGDTHMWVPGKERKIFDLNGFVFATPVCFEDTFGADCREFVQNGAKAFVNLSNDFWAESRKCQIQHLQAAVFRSIENRVPSVRSCASGETCIINSCGKITVRAVPFEKNYICGKMAKY